MGHLLDMARRALTAMGGELGGSVEQGAFRIRQGKHVVEGLYRTEPGWFHVELTRKPLLLRCNTVREWLIDALNQAERTAGNDSSPLAA